MTIRQGHNVIAGGSGRQLQDAFPLFFDHRFTFDPQDIRWVNSEAYSWLDGEVYRGGYNKLLSQYQPTGTFRATSLNYTCVFSDLSIVETNVPVSTGTVADLQAWATAAGYTTTGTAIEELVVHKSLLSSSETVANTTISFYRCYDKKKIVLTDQISAVEAIYAATGVAEYFILDIANKRFKLPRNKWGKYGTGSGDLGDYISESLPNIKGVFDTDDRRTHIRRATGPFYTSTAPNNLFAAMSTISGNTEGVGFDASRASSTYKDNAPVQPRGAKGDLYFYLGATDAGIVEKASVVDSLLQSKADTSLSNITSAGKETLASWCVPDYASGIAVSASPYTAPCAGRFIIVCAGSPNISELFVNGVRVAYYKTASGAFDCWLAADVDTGDVITYTITGSTTTVTFYPLKGAK